jgi:hypothetical protein
MKGIDLEARKRTTIPAENYDRIDAFWANFEHSMVLPELQALHQMVMVEGPSFRRSLVSHMGANVKMGASAVILAQRAVFDLDPDVRTLAIEALSHHKTENYLPTLLDALHHPWAPAAAHAAEALAALKPHEALPQLVEMLAQPDPTAPFTKRVDGKQVKVVRELVAVNHLRNCLLCHAPSTSQKDIIRGPLPTPGVPIPTSSAVYYAERNAAALIRADITYLKQDFSVMQPVKDHGVWPEQQRFDYLVRVRPLTAAENAAFKRQQRAKKTPPLSEHKQVILYTLRELTGQDAGTSVAEWRKVIAAIKK